MTMLIPLNGLVLIDPVKEPRNKAGILLPDCWQGKDMTGTVVQAHAKSDLKPGTWSSCRSSAHRRSRSPAGSSCWSRKRSCWGWWHEVAQQP